VNECLNVFFWDRCPKFTYVEQETVALIATYLAVLMFNDGEISCINILNYLDPLYKKCTEKVKRGEKHSDTLEKLYRYCQR
jgi:hypothetical protein